MPDRIDVVINGIKISRFKSFTIEADIYTADHAFSLELAKPETRIAKGDLCDIYINNEQVLTGIIEIIKRSYDKSGSSLSIQGRDLMGLLVDSHCEQFVTVAGKTLSQLAQMLLKTVPFINRKNITYQDDVVGKLRSRRHRGGSQGISLVAMMDSAGTAQRLAQIEPGMTVFECLKMYAASRGLMFFSLPDGTFVFGRLKVGGEAAFKITHRMDGKGNNVEQGEETIDISKRYSKVSVIGQQQGCDAMGMDATQIQTRGSVSDPDFPFYKPFVQKNNNDSQSPALHARLLLEKMRHDGYQLSYRAAGFSQAGKVWTINELCKVKDEQPEMNIDGTFLIFNRKFTYDRSSGSQTFIKLGLPGLVSTETLGRKR